MEAFDKSSLTLFREFLALHKGVRGWVISADFCLHDPSRPEDCFAFTIFPYDGVSIDSESISKAIPRDLKNSKTLSETGVEWLKDQRKFHIVIIANRDRTVFYNGPSSSQLEVIREHVNKTLEEALTLNVSDEVFKWLKKLKQQTLSNSFNMNLFSDIWLLAVFFATIGSLLEREGVSGRIGWFPDRDNMTTFCDGIWQFYTMAARSSLLEALAVNPDETKIVIAVPDRSGVKEVMWFDHFIRSADWLAGCVAAWDRKTNLIPGEHDKYRQVIEEVVAKARNTIILRFHLTDRGAQVNRILVSEAEPAAQLATPPDAIGAELGAGVPPEVTS